ncbi:hypothetical protein IGI04_015003 [Brassica rapa subsp. trilocularis]|uniref:RNase H type-1 domain-containing protein n=1 Tax=Brassica rapa subsp. trilocularis TaxID=1813537 RepID=A0ABQ7MNS8_BRACM|nr:hypothetical protein IGI04_015003 [Brassica rapa subsp. trilocularis]
MNGVIHSSLKEWDVEILENLVAQDNLSFIRSLAVSHSNRDEKYRYWVAKNILSREPEVMVSNQSITKFQAFTWKIKLHKKCVIWIVNFRLTLQWIWLGMVDVSEDEQLLGLRNQERQLCHFNDISYLQERFQAFNITHIPRVHNQITYFLAKTA